MGFCLAYQMSYTGINSVYNKRCKTNSLLDWCVCVSAQLCQLGDMFSEDTVVRDIGGHP